MARVKGRGSLQSADPMPPMKQNGCGDDSSVSSVNLLSDVHSSTTPLEAQISRSFPKRSAGLRFPFDHPELGRLGRLQKQASQALFQCSVLTGAYMFDPWETVLFYAALSILLLLLGLGIFKHVAVAGRQCMALITALRNI